MAPPVLVPHPILPRTLPSADSTGLGLIVITSVGLLITVISLIWFGMWWKARQITAALAWAERMRSNQILALFKDIAEEDNW